ncbi:MAG TPA: peptidylprolyl isomerase [Clostridiales bacterium]|nr:peptidylprolyl isomerase [Clostridiales bacterium]
MKKIIALLLALLCFAPVLSSCGEDELPDRPEVEIKVKDFGTIRVELRHDQAPITVENFISLAESGFYDGLTFHRIMQSFMIQGGDPKGNGTGGSDKTIKGEFRANGVNNTLTHLRGTISMARSSAYDSASSQFFICNADSTFLDGNYAAFGYVTEGMDVVDAITEYARKLGYTETVPKEDQPVIESIRRVK